MAPARAEISPREKSGVKMANGEYKGFGNSEVPRMRPLLKGVLDLNSHGQTTWEGKWAMQESDFDGDGSRLNEFSYVFTSKSDIEEEKDQEQKGGSSQQDGPKDGYLSGYFMLQRTNIGNTSPRVQTTHTKHVEKKVLVQFKPKPDSKIDYDVYGEGQNKFGKFQLEGFYNANTKILSVFRNYRPRKGRVVSLTRVARELELDRQNSGLSQIFGGIRSEEQQRKASSSDAMEVEETNVQDTRRRRGSNQSKSDAEAKRPEPQRNFTGKKWLMRIEKILEELMAKDERKWFCVPVDARALGLVDYHDIILNPMDLGTIKKNLENEKYTSADSVREDIELTFKNALHYNSRGHPVYRKADELLKVFQELYNRGIARKSSAGIEADVPGAIARIGKRTPVPKIAFELKTGSQYSRTSKRRRDMNVEYEDGDNELTKLRKQVKRLSKHLSSLGDAFMQQQNSFQMPANALTPLPIDTTTKESTLKRQFSFDDKQQLGKDIHDLPPEKIAKVIEIIQESGAQLQPNEAGEVELDIDTLDVPTLRKLRRFVSKHRVMDSSLF